VRPADRKFRRELDTKIARLEQRLAEYRSGDLTPGQNPGFDRMAEALFLRGDWSRSKEFGKKASDYWRLIFDNTAEDAKKCEPVFHLGSAHLFADDLDAARDVFSKGVQLYVKHGMAGSDDTGYMAAVAGDLRRAEVVFHAAVVADMTAQGMGDLKLFGKRFPDTPRLLKLHFVQGLARKDRPLVEGDLLYNRWLLLRKGKRNYHLLDAATS